MSGIDIGLMIETLTTSGREELDSALLAELKKYCKTNHDKSELFSHLGRLIFHQLQQKHAQIRFSALLLIEYFFERSHQFRLYTCQHLDQFFKFCFQLYGCKLKDGSFVINSSENKKEILQPTRWAKKLKQRALECFKYWHQEFRNGYHILNDCIDFLVSQRLLQQASTSQSQINQTSSRERTSHLIQNQSTVLVKQLDELEDYINLLIMQIDTCFELLIPKFKISEDNCPSKDELQFRPMQGLSFNIILNSKVEIIYDDTNCDLLNNLRELCRELAKYEGRLNDISKLSSSLSYDKKIKEDFCATIQNLKLKITSILWKEKEIKILNSPLETEELKTSSNSELSSSDENDFEDVVETEANLLISKIEGFDGIVSPNGKASSGQAVSIVDGQCGALLPSGRVCPRRDRVKCPFHGIIIPRDPQGLPLDSALKEKELQMRFQKEANQWKDPKYLKALSEQTGKNLQLNTRRKRNKDSALIDLKELNDTPRKRLKRKLRKELNQYQLRDIHVAELTTNDPD